MKLICWIVILICSIVTRESYAHIGNARNINSIEECIQLALLNSSDAKIQDYNQQINELNLASSIHSTKPSFSISLSPVYNQSISSVTQPDGSIKNIGVQHASGLLSFNTSIPVYFTGGNISINQSFNYYRYFNHSTSYTNFGINLYQVSYSQPLSFFRRNKFIKQTAISNYSIKSLKKYSTILNIKKEVIDDFFDILLAKETIKLLDSILYRYDVIKIHYKLLYKSGKSLLMDLELLSLEIDKTHISKQKYQNTLLNKSKLLWHNLNQDNNKEQYDFQIPEIIEYRFNNHLLHHRLDSLQACYKRFVMTATEQQLSEAKSNLSDLPTITLGVGNNTSFESFSQFKTNLRPSYNISVSYSTNLTDINERKRKFASALLNKNIFLEEINIKNGREDIYLDELLDNINMCFQQSRLLKQSITTNLNSLEVKHKLLEAQRITLNEFNEHIRILISLNTEIINNLRSYYTNIAQLECLMQLDNVLDLVI